MRLVTVATHSEGYFPYLQLSCHRLGIDLRVLGWQQPWQGWMWRLRLVREFLVTCKPEDVVCFIDAYDVLMLQPLDVLQRKFEALVPPGAHKIVVAKDIAQSRMIETMSIAFFGECKKSRINAGTYVGRAGTIVHLIDTMCADGACAQPKTDDQVLLTKLCKAMPDAVVIDTERELFLTIANHGQNIDLSAAAIEIDPAMKSLRVRIEGRWRSPCIVHAPASTRMDNILQKMGYPIFTDRSKPAPTARMIAECIVVLLTMATVTILASTRYGALCACPARAFKR